jgi:hypothetical protein
MAESGKGRHMGKNATPTPLPRKPRNPARGKRIIRHKMNYLTRVSE